MSVSDIVIAQYHYRDNDISNKIKGGVIMMYELKPTNQKSFYGKAKVIIIGSVQYLKSYDTIVCYLVNNTLYKTWNDYSATTMKHVNAFLESNNMSKLSKKEWGTVPTKQITLKQYNAITNNSY